MSDAVIRRSTLISQIGTVFRERGYDGATLTQLAAATGLGKASLYHHFPGGKAEMAEVLLREAVAKAERLAFARLAGSEAPTERLQRFLAGYQDYLEQNGGVCLLAVLGFGNIHTPHSDEITAQFESWRAALARVYETLGHKPKRAARAALELLGSLYGAQVAARLAGDPQQLRRALKRLARNL